MIDHSMDGKLRFRSFWQLLISLLVHCCLFLHFIYYDSWSGFRQAVKVTPLCVLLLYSTWMFTWPRNQSYPNSVWSDQESCYFSTMKKFVTCWDWTTNLPISSSVCRPPSQQGWSKSLWSEVAYYLQILETLQF